MQLARPSAPRETPADLAAALRSAQGELGHRPAVTVVGRDRRDEQGFASLAQWAAKGAHLLELDLLLEPGDVLALDSPAGWTGAAVALAAWWSGVAISLDPTVPAAAAVVEEGRTPPSGAAEVFWLGDAVDGAPTGEVPGEAWAHAVQSFPDQPPAPRAAHDRLALVASGERWTQAELIAEAEGLGEGGALGIDRSSPSAAPMTLVALAVRPLLVGKPTVVLRHDDRTAAAGERVTRWL